MRQLARFDLEDSAHKLADALLVEGIDTRVDPSREGHFVVWVHDERELEKAQAILSAYESDPADPRFAEARRQASELRRDAAKNEMRERRESQRIKRSIAATRQSGVGPVTMTIIIACGFVALLSAAGDRETVLRYLSYASYDAVGPYIQYKPFEDILGGQLWRLVTPAFMHASITEGVGIFHIIFNMWWMKDLGTAVERVQSSWLLVVLVLVSAIFSNTLQFLVSGPLFHGMSGVVMAVFGYIWMRAKFELAGRYSMPNGTVAWLMGFYILGMVGLIGGIANWAHTGGLVVGIVWGFLSSGYIQRKLSS